MAGIIMSVLPTAAKNGRAYIDLSSVKCERPTELRSDNPSYHFKSPMEVFQSFHHVSNGWIYLSQEMIDSLVEHQPKTFVLRSKLYGRKDVTKQIAAHKARLKQVETDNGNICVLLENVAQNYGQKITNPEQRTAIEYILSKTTDEKLKKNIKKDLDKDKISKKLSEPLQQVYAPFWNEYCFAQVALQLLNEPYGDETIPNELAEFFKTYPDFNSLPENTKADIERHPDSSKMMIRRAIYEERYRAAKTKDKPMEVFADTVANPFLLEQLLKYPTNIYEFNAGKMRSGGKKWLWVVDSDYKKKSESYPVNVEYKSYASHPEYNNKFDASIFTRNKNQEVDNALLRQSYKSNAYNIQSAKAATKDYITLKLGLRGQTAQEKKASDQAAQMMANGLIGHMTANARHGRDTKAAQRQKDKAALSFLAGMVSVGNIDQDGANWIKQVFADWSDRLRIDDYEVFVIERVDNVTYDVTYYDKDGKAVVKATYKFVNDGPYKSKKVTTVTIQ